MASRRERVLDAAIGLLGTRDSRGLTHRGVDELAGLPAGSTSNYFRTREALLCGVADRLAERDKQDWARLTGLPVPGTVAEVVDGMTAFAQYSAGPDRTRTLARYRIFLAAADSAQIRGSILRARAELVRWATTALREVARFDAEAIAPILMDAVEGITLHQLAAGDPDFDPRPSIERLVSALVVAGS